MTNETTLSEDTKELAEATIIKPTPWHPVSTFLFNLIWASALTTCVYFITQAWKQQP